MFGPSVMIDVSLHDVHQLINTKKPQCSNATSDAIWHQNTLEISHYIGNKMNIILLRVAIVVIAQEPSPWRCLLAL